MKHQFAWHSPAPLWTTQLGSENEPRKRFLRPEILRFEGDDFMEQLFAQLESDPEGLEKYLLRPETWETPPDTTQDPPDLGKAVKLFQPTHGRYYLAVASLVCQTAGLPDRTADLAVGELISFVLRRARAGESDVEYGWCGPKAGWKTVASDRVLDDEELLPTFPLSTEQELTYGGRTKIQPRRLHAGLVPVSSVETYNAGELSLVPSLGDAQDADSPDSDEGLLDPRVSEFEAVVEDGFLPLWIAIDETGTDDEDDPKIDLTREIFALSVLDLHLFFVEQFGDQYQEVLEDLNVANKLKVFRGADWDSFLDEAAEFGNQIADGDLSNTTDLRTSKLNIKNRIDELFDVPGTPTVDSLVAALRAELGELPEGYAYASAGEPSAEPNQSPKLVTADQDGEVEYFIRFVYDRPQCRAPFERMTGGDSERLAQVRSKLANLPHYRPVVSSETQHFKLAPFFDPEAPQRPIRITMPVDTSPSGLRKFPRSVGFVLSKKLRAQMQQASQEVENISKIGKGGSFNFDLGVICSFSIPIITIVALILLLLFVFILNIVFWWLPFFRICFPILLPSENEDD